MPRDDEDAADEGVIGSEEDDGVMEALLLPMCPLEMPVPTWMLSDQSYSLLLV